MSLEHTSALVTGGASGMGEATGRRLAAEGAQVVVVDRDVTKGEGVAKEIGGVFCEADVTDEETVRAAVAAAVELAPLRTCIHCAGVGWAERTIDRNGNPHDLDRFRKIIEINLVGTFNVLRLAAAGMAGNEPDAYGERGGIVNTASVAAYDGQSGQAAYPAPNGVVPSLTLTPPPAPPAPRTASARSRWSRPDTTTQTAKSPAWTAASAWRRNEPRTLSERPFSIRTPEIADLPVIHMKEVREPRGIVREFYRESAFVAAG